MPNAVRISVVIPVKDDDTELARCLGALARQIVPADEVIVVDNGSTDASADVARAFGARLVRCESPGIPAASYPASLAARPDVAAFSGSARFIDGPRLLRRPLATLYLGAYAAVMIPTLGHLPLFGSNMGLRRPAWLGIRSSVHRDADLHDDMDLSFHLGERGRTRHLSGARMGISMRPFAPGQAFGRRVARGLRTVLVHFPHDFPPVRWTRRSLRMVMDPAPEHMRPRAGRLEPMSPRRHRGR